MWGLSRGIVIPHPASAQVSLGLREAGFVLRVNASKFKVECRFSVLRVGSFAARIWNLREVSGSKKALYGISLRRVRGAIFPKQTW